jgi:hypothetical protein
MNVTAIVDVDAGLYVIKNWPERSLTLQVDLIGHEVMELAEGGENRSREVAVDDVKLAARGYTDHCNCMSLRKPAFISDIRLKVNWGVVYSFINTTECELMGDRIVLRHELAHEHHRMVSVATVVQGVLVLLVQNGLANSGTTGIALMTISHTSVQTGVHDRQGVCPAQRLVHRDVGWFPLTVGLLVVVSNLIVIIEALKDDNPHEVGDKNRFNRHDVSCYQALELMSEITSHTGFCLACSCILQELSTSGWKVDMNHRCN